VKSTWRTALADLRAAAVLAHPQALDLALEGVRRQPELAGNQPLDPGQIEQLLLPVGEILGRPAVPWAYLQQVQRDRLAGLRAAASVAAFQRWLAGADQAVPMLEQAVADRRPEVLEAVILSARQAARQAPARLLALAVRWTTSGAPAAPRAAAYRLLAPLARLQPEDILPLAAAAPMAETEKENAALAELLVALGQAGCGEALLELLQSWSLQGRQTSWVICRALSSSWAAQHPARALEILDVLEHRGEHSRQISRTRQALTGKADG
jgi:hypothetical protein